MCNAYPVVYGPEELTTTNLAHNFNFSKGHPVVFEIQ
jgi:hypothetical protein